MVACSGERWKDIVEEWVKAQRIWRLAAGGRVGGREARGENGGAVRRPSAIARAGTIARRRPEVAAVVVVATSPYEALCLRRAPQQHRAR